MGNCTSSSAEDEFLKDDEEEDNNLPDVPAVVYIDITVHDPAQPHSLEVEGTTDTIEWYNVVNFDNIVTRFEKGTSKLAQLTVHKGDSCYHRRLCSSEGTPKPVIDVTVSNPEDIKTWNESCKISLGNIINDEFGDKKYYINITCTGFSKTK